MVYVRHRILFRPDLAPHTLEDLIFAPGQIEARLSEVSFTFRTLRGVGFDFYYDPCPPFELALFRPAKNFAEGHKILRDLDIDHFGPRCACHRDDQGPPG